MLFGLGYAGIMPCYSLIIRVLFPVTELGWRIAWQYLFAFFGMALGGWLGGAGFGVTRGYFLGLRRQLVGTVRAEGRRVRVLAGAPG